MTTDPNEPLERAAEQVADGASPPIAGAAGRSGDIRRTLENLRVLARVGEVHRAALALSEEQRPPEVTPLFAWGPLLALERLGAGSFGEVYRALDPALGREVALKLRPAWDSGEAPADRRWLDEARRLARVRHPNVVQVHGAAVYDGRPGLWMELVRGETLERQLERRGCLGWREACVLGLELCAALAAVHAAGLVHQDVKASNVMREGGPGMEPTPGSSGRIVLMDFGAGQRLDARGRGMGGTFGTPLSCAPEVLAGEAPTPRSDIYSLGALLFRLVTGRHPIEAATGAEILEIARAERATPLRSLRADLPAGFVVVVERALHRDPQRRYESVADLERVLAGALILSSPTPVPRRRGVVGMWSLVVAVAVVVVVAGFWAVRHRRQEGTSVPSHAPPLPVSGRAASKGQPAAPAAAVPTVGARLLRAAPGGPEEVHNGDLVAPGDQLALSLTTQERLWVYALDHDRTGKVTVLFPVSGLAPSNPLPPGRHRLPGAREGRALDWQVTSAGGRETFLFVASRRAVPAIETGMASLPAAREGSPVADARLDGGATGPARGITGLAPSRIPNRAAPDRFEALMRSLAARADSSVWLERLEVENPSR